MKFLLKWGVFILSICLVDRLCWYDPAAENYHQQEWWQIIFGAVFLAAMILGVWCVYHESVYGDKHAPR